MAFEIPAHFYSSFTTNVELLLQRAGPSLLPGVMTQNYGGENAQVIKQFGDVEFTEKASRHADTVFSDIEHKQRWVFPTDYTLALPIDNEDELRMLDSPLSSYAAAMRTAWARLVDDRIYEAMLGDAQTGKNGSTTTPFDAANQTIAAGATGLTVEKLRLARKKLKEAHNDLANDQAFIAVNAQRLDDLLATTEVTSSDFNTVRALVQGELDTFLGFKFVSFEGITQDGSGDDRIPVWVRSGMTYASWQGLITRIDERPDKEYLTQVFMAGTNSATRTQEPKVIEILCNTP